jgi:hypothetical protein
MTESNVELRWINIPPSAKANNAYAWVEVDMDTGAQVLRAWVTENADEDFAGMYTYGAQAAATKMHDTLETCKAACIQGWERLKKKILDDARASIGIQGAT